MRLSSQTSGSERRRGFTLIELLVVIAIIAILAAILFPVFAQARAKARQTSCLSNEKQLGLSIMQYYQDYDEAGPVVRAFTTGYASIAGDPWDIRISPYIGQRVASKGAPGIFACPDDSVERFNGESVRSYAINALYPWHNGPGAAEDILPKDGVIEDLRVLGNLADFPEPAGTILIAENFKKINQYGKGAATEVRTPSRPSWAGKWFEVQDRDDDAKPTAIKPTHSGGWNYIFLDGHAKWLKPERTVGKGTLASPRGMWSRRADD